MGVMIAGIGMLCFVAHQRMGGGANLSCTSLYLSLLYMAANNYPLGPQFRLLLDNTCSENKCNEVIFFICWLVAMDYFEDASFFCMLKGHTFTTLDQTFNTMITKLMQTGIYCVSSLLNRVWRALRPYDCLSVMELHALWDWVEYFKPHISYRLGGFTTSQFGSGMHEFYCRKDTAGKVRLWVRKSSQASSWMPEGPGMEVFASLPTGEPPLAKYKYSEQDWKRNELQGSLRAWYRHMSCDGPQEAYTIEKEWQKTFERLPDNDDPNNLASELKPIWGELPKCTETPEIRTHILDGVGTSLENPPINPVTGPGRTNAEVRRETIAYRSFIRRMSGGGATVVPVFQGDYVFVQLPSKPIFLSRIVNSCNIDDAISETIMFTIGEYSHDVQPGVAGFFGTFTKTLNTAYDPQDKRAGGKFIRHTNITRREVVVYNVQTWVDRKLLAERAADERGPYDCLRVAASSLRKLESLRSDCMMPTRMPRSHAEQDAAASDAAAAAARREQEGDDPLPSIPPGFYQVCWKAGGDICDFMIFTRICSRAAAWHQAKVTKALTVGSRGFTHDARFAGEQHSRGVQLTKKLHDDGYWVAMAPLSASSLMVPPLTPPLSGAQPARLRTSLMALPLTSPPSKAKTKKPARKRALMAPPLTPQPPGAQPVRERTSQSASQSSSRPSNCGVQRRRRTRQS